MRLLCLSIGIGLLGIAHTVHAEPSPPYTAYVSADDVYVRSGPGSNYYPTDKLSTGAQVEVYRHDSGGWYAIRPPKNSFSWVSSRYVEPTENGLGRVTDQRAVARVGSRFSNVRDVIQIRLDKGETVEILGERNVGGQTWYKIAPPSGEFRWMSGRTLDHRPPSQRAESTPVAKGPDSGQLERPVGDEPRPAEWSTARRGDTAFAPGTSSGQDHLIDLAAADEDQTSLAEAAPESGTEGPISDLNRINHALSVMVAEEPSVWELSEIKHQTEAIAGQARTDAEREGVNRLLHKIARLEDIKARHDRLMPSPRVPRAGRSDSGRGVSTGAPASDGRTHWRTSSVANGPQRAGLMLQTVPLPGPVPASSPVDQRDVPTSSGRISLSRGDREPPSAPSLAARPSGPHRGGQPTVASMEGHASFDSVGTLRPVVSRRRAAPRYALVDPRGTVVSFVTAGPGIDLKPYLGKRIGVAGKRSYIPEFRRTHVTARHVMTLSETTLR